MADDVREYLRAAQQAEVRGDKGQAVEFLQKAARLYRSQGNNTRALSMLRHASRLDGGRRVQIDEEIRRLEWIPETPLSHAMPDEEDEGAPSEEDDALSVLDAFQKESSGRERELIERGPTRADPALAAWCSFCCRPKTEVGDLVAGPASAFICMGCVRECARLLGDEALAGAGGAEARGPGGSALRSSAEQRSDGASAGGPASSIAAPAEESSRGGQETANGAREESARGERASSATVEEWSRVRQRRGSAEQTEASSHAMQESASGARAEESTRGEKGTGSSARAEESTRGEKGTASGAWVEESTRGEKGTASGAREEDSSRALGRAPESGISNATSGEGATERDSRSSPRRAPLPLVGQGAASALLDSGMRLGARWMLLLGPEGVGKTTYLEELARKGLGRYLLAGESLEGVSPEERLLVDGLEALEPAALARWISALERLEPASVVLSWRGQLESGGVRARSDELELALPTTRELVAATEGKLGSSLLRRIQVVAPFVPLTEAELEELGRQLLARRASELDVSDELLKALVAEALRSGAGGSELAALVDRLPSGTWTAASGAPPPAKRKRRSKKTES